MEVNNGKFVISLDFELMWGVRDVETIETYGQHVKGVHEVLPKLLSYFTAFNIHATFAAVGFLFFENKKELLENLPLNIPAYTAEHLSPYGSYINNNVGQDRFSDPYHFGSHLIELIKNTPGQEIATHTFSHYYCLEEGQNIQAFTEDLEAAIGIARKKNIDITTIIFPRNQVNEQYLDICMKHGIQSYRHNEQSWIYKARTSKEESLLRRSVRLVDAYLNISGNHCYQDEIKVAARPLNIPSSRFLRPYSRRLRWLEWLRLKRITNSMTFAAKHNLTYHLWWHPHNFGINQDQNFLFLEKILLHFRFLKEKYSFTSLNMSDVSKRLYAVKGS